MKKLLGIAVLAVALSGLMSCASKEAKPAGLPHPRSYTIDVADGKSDSLGTSDGTVKLVFNQYGPNYQETVDFTPFVKFNKPLAGDTIDVSIKGVSDKDIEILNVNVVDTSAAYSYWGVLTGTDGQPIEGVKAGEPFEATFSFPLTSDMKGNFKIVLMSETLTEAATITLEKVTNTTDTSTEVVIEERVPQTYDMDFTKYAAFLEVKTNHPWIDGVQDMSVISNYEAVVDITNFFPADKLPIAGDKLNITWKVSSDTDIAKLCMRVIENTPAVNWWKELDVNAGTGQVVAENIVAGEPLVITASFDYAEAAVEGASIVIYYDVGDADRPAIFKLVRD